MVLEPWLRGSHALGTEPIGGPSPALLGPSVRWPQRKNELQYMASCCRGSALLALTFPSAGNLTTTCLAKEDSFPGCRVDSGLLGNDSWGRWVS